MSRRPMMNDPRRMAVPRLILVSLVCLAATGCSRLPTLPGTGIGGAQPDTALPYPASVSGREGDPAAFDVAVTTGGAPLPATRESVRFPATRYCLARFGTSDIVWSAPAAAPDAWTGRLAPDGRVVYGGRCAGR
jgi:hypothetical protein